MRLRRQVLFEIDSEVLGQILFDILVGKDYIAFFRDSLDFEARVSVSTNGAGSALLSCALLFFSPDDLHDFDLVRQHFCFKPEMVRHNLVTIFIKLVTFKHVKGNVHPFVIFPYLSDEI